MGCGASTQIVQNIDLGKLTKSVKTENSHHKKADNECLHSVDNADKEMEMNNRTTLPNDKPDEQETVNCMEEVNAKVNFTAKEHETVNRKENENDLGGITKEKVIEEVRRLFAGKEKVEAFIKSGTDLVQFIREDSIGGNVLNMLTKPLSLVAMFSPSMKVVQCTATISALYIAFQKISNAWNSHVNSIDHEKMYSALEKFEESKLVTKAKGFEKSISADMAYFSKIDDKASENTINALENRIDSKDIVRFLYRLQSNVEKQMKETNVESVYKAIEFIDLYFHIANLRNAMLWQVYCIKLKYGTDKSSSEGVKAIIEECRKNDLELAKSITKVTIEQATFFSFFHPTEKENCFQFLKIHEEECNIQVLHKNTEFIGREHVICCPNLQGRHLKMPEKTQDYIKCVDESLTPSKFKFEPVEGREWDNIFFLKSAQSRHYVYMKNDEYCYSEQDKPGPEGQWKLVKFEESQGHPKFLISTLKKPVHFLYIYHVMWPGDWWLAGTTHIKTALDKGLWNISSV